MPNSSRTEDHRDQVRRRILDAAQELFDSHGIEGMSMRALGKRAGLTGSALCDHFPTKIDLLRELRWEALDQLHCRMAEISQSEPDPVAAIRVLGHAHTEFALENPIAFTDSAAMFPFMPPSVLAATMIDVLVAGLCVEPDNENMPYVAMKIRATANAEARQIMTAAQRE